MSQVTIVTEDNINQTAESIRQLLVGQKYTVVTTKVDLYGESKPFVHTRSGHYVESEDDVTIEKVEGIISIVIDDNIGVYMIRLGSQLLFHQNGFRVIPRQPSSSKEWTFKVEE